METVGVRDLKTHLSRHLKRVRSGTRLLVTVRGRSIATISPVEAPADVDWAHQTRRGGARSLERWEAGGRPPPGEGQGEDRLVGCARGSPMTLYLDTGRCRLMAQGSRLKASPGSWPGVALGPIGPSAPVGP